MVSGPEKKGDGKTSARLDAQNAEMEPEILSFSHSALKKSMVAADNYIKALTTLKQL